MSDQMEQLKGSMETKMDLVLQRMCGECYTIEDLYGTNTCGHRTYCFECGCKLALTETPCSDCGVPLTSLIKEYKVRPYKKQLEGGQEATYYMLSVKGKLFVRKGDGTLVWYHGLYDTVKNLEKPLLWKEAWDLHFNPSRNTIKSEPKKTDETPIVRRPLPTALVKRTLNADASESKRSKRSNLEQNVQYEDKNVAPVKTKGNSESKSKRSKPQSRMQKGEKSAPVEIEEAPPRVVVPKQSRSGSDLNKRSRVVPQMPITTKRRTVFGKRTAEADASKDGVESKKESKRSRRESEDEKGATPKTKRVVPAPVPKQSGGSSLGSDLVNKKTRKTPIPKFLVKKPKSTMTFNEMVGANALEDDKESKKLKVEKGKKAIEVQKKVVKRSKSQGGASTQKPHGGNMKEKNSNRG